MLKYAEKQTQSMFFFCCRNDLWAHMTLISIIWKRKYFCLFRRKGVWLNISIVYGYCVKVWFSYLSHLLFLWKNRFNCIWPSRIAWGQAESLLNKPEICMIYSFNSSWIHIFKQKDIELKVYAIFLFFLHVVLFLECMRT